MARAPRTWRLSQHQGRTVRIKWQRAIQGRCTSHRRGNMYLWYLQPWRCRSTQIYAEMMIGLPLASTAPRVCASGRPSSKEDGNHHQSQWPPAVARGHDRKARSTAGGSYRSRDGKANRGRTCMEALVTYEYWRRTSGGRVFSPDVGASSPAAETRSTSVVLAVLPGVSPDVALRTATRQRFHATRGGIVRDQLGSIARDCWGRIASDYHTQAA